ncbi:MAG TPA: YceI family protein [Rhodanobacteraceae bacterium]|nr:YceI family protein [Rhodanobacteraceae bacterium]
MLIRSLVLALVALASTPILAAETYTLDPRHTQALFTWNHLGFSNPTGNFNEIDGTLVFDADDPSGSSVEVTIPVASIDTHVPALDEHLKKADFFDAEKYPTITFKSTRVERGAAPDTFEVTGDLSIHGVTRPVRLLATLNRRGEHPMSKAPAIGFDATTTFKRSAFGMGADVPGVSDEIRVHITTEAKGARPAGK